jgi:predicted nucleotidyltransferase
METIKLKFTRLQNSIFRLICIKAGEKLNLSEISKLLKVSVTAVSKAVPSIEEQKIIKIEKDKKMNLTLISLDRANKKAIQMKRAENLRMVYEYGLSDYLEDEFAGGTIILFGSFSKGDDTISSDIDIAVIGRKEKEIDFKKFEEIFQRKIIINFYPSFNDIHKHLKENILNGIILSGGVEL